MNEGVPAERFETLKQSAIHSLKTRFRNLKDKSALWNQLAFEKGADFDYVNKRIAALESLSYEQFEAFAHKALARHNLKRLAVLYEGRLQTPFDYKSMDVAQLREISKYTAKPVFQSSVEQSSEKVR